MNKRFAAKVIGVSLAGMMALPMVSFGASGTEVDVPDGSIELAYNLSTDDYSIFQKLIKDFTDQTGIQVTINNLGGDYESAMKTKMASNDLPDMWVTHGWSLIRYSEYMMDLSDQDWVSKIDSGLKSVITNDDGQLFILPITQAVASIMYNKDVVEAAGVDISKIRTWDDFNDACQKVADSGKTPIEMVLTDAYDSYTLEGLWPTELTNDGVPDKDKNIEQLKDGTFDWTSHTEAWDTLEKWYENGWINDDVTSGKRDQVLQALANGDGAFTLFSTENIPQIRMQNTDANIGILPYPSVAEDAPSYFGTGEGNFSCFGIWKDTKYEDQCKQLLNYLAKPEIAAQIVKIDGGIPALSDTKVESGTDAAYTADAFKEAQKIFDGDLYYDNFFDREYLPSGMWSVMTDSVDTLLANEDPATDKEAAIEIVQDNYDDLMGN